MFSTPETYNDTRDTWDKQHDMRRLILNVTQVSWQFICQWVPERQASNKEGPTDECSEATSQNQYRSWYVRRQIANAVDWQLQRLVRSSSTGTAAPYTEGIGGQSEWAYTKPAPRRPPSAAQHAVAEQDQLDHTSRCQWLFVQLRWEHVAVGQWVTETRHRPPT